jgi:FlaA1/EpsC-like NDP-sugar epimerase
MLATQHDAAQHPGVPVLVYGAGQMGGRVLPQLLNDDVYGMHVAGFIDDDPEKAGKLIQGIAVWGGIENLDLALRQTGARKVVVASRKIGPDRLAVVRMECDRRNVEVARLAVDFDRMIEPAVVTGFPGTRGESAIN